MKRKLLLLYAASSAHRQEFQSIAPEWDIVATTDKYQAAELIEYAEVVMGNHFLSESLPYNKNTLRWIQTNSVGIDIIIQKCGVLPANIIFTNAKGVYNDEISEHTLALIFSLLRNLHYVRDNQLSHNWSRPEQLPLLKGQRVLITGYGSLGKSIAEKLSILGCTVYGINTSPGIIITNNEQRQIGNWRELLPKTDILISLLPATPATKHFIGKEELEKLPANAIVLNIGRPETLDEQALYALLISGKIKGAALDVFKEEPLNEKHPAWNIPNLIISPHMARSREVKPPFQFEPLFVQNFKRYISGGQLLNIVDMKKGY